MGGGRCSTSAGEERFSGWENDGVGFEEVIDAGGCPRYEAVGGGIAICCGYG